MNVEIIVSICAVVLCAAGLTFQHFGVLSSIKERLTAVETKVSLFWQAVGVKVADMLKSPTNLRKDELLDKVKNGNMTMAEAIELKGILEKEFRDKDLDSGLSVAYVCMIGHLELKIYEINRGEA